VDLKSFECALVMHPGRFAFTRRACFTASESSPPPMCMPLEGAEFRLRVCGHS